LRQNPTDGQSVAAQVSQLKAAGCEKVFREVASGAKADRNQLRRVANTAAIVSYNAEQDADVEIRQVKYLNNIVEQDHRAIRRLVRPMLGFKGFPSAAITLAGIEIMHMIRKGQLSKTGKLRPAKQFYSLAG
jgi:transposase-like protein